MNSKPSTRDITQSHTQHIIKFTIIKFTIIYCKIDVWFDFQFLS